MSISENKKETIKSGALALTGNLIGKVVSLPVGIYVASVLNPAGYGLLAMVTVIIQYLSYLNLGVLSNINREVPIAYGQNDFDEVKVIYDTVFTNYLITTLFSIIVLWILHLLGLSFTSELSTVHFLIISFIIMTANAESFLHSYLKGEGKFLIYGQYEFVSKLLIPLASLVFVYFFGFTGMLLSLIFTHILGSVFILLKVKWPRLHFSLNLAKTKELFSTGIFMFFNKIVDGFLISIVILLASIFFTSPDLGILSFSLGFFEISKIPFAAILTVTVDRKMAYIAGIHGVDNYKNYSIFLGTTYVVYLLFLSIAFGIFIIFYSIVVKIFLQEYIAAIPLLITLFFALNFYNARFFLNSYINITRQMKKRTVILIVGVLVNIIFGYLSVKLGYGISGLAMVVAFSMIVISVQTVLFVFRQVYGSSKKGYYFLLKILIISGLSTALLYGYQDFKFIYYDLRNFDSLQILLAAADFGIKSISFVTLVFCLFIGLFRQDKVDSEIRSLSQYVFLKVVSSIGTKMKP
jgi:O-antigen/teichoic acid export membrane protein